LQDITDQDLVRAALHGQVQAFAALVDRYRYAVFGLCLGYTRDTCAAEDAAQDAFVKAFLELKRLSDRSRFGPWLRQIAANECRQWLRQRVRQVPLADDQEAAIESTQRPVDVALEERETRRQVLAALGRLSQLQQQVVALFYLEGLSLKQIAKFLEISLQTTNQRLYRARSALKEEMLKMVEETLGQQKLPDNFTQEVVQAALAKGQELLVAKRWPEAKAEFRKITIAVDEHLEAQRGLALALDGQVNAMLAAPDQANDEKLVHEALAALEEAYRLGARDWETVWNLAGFYWTLDRQADRVRVLVAFAAEADDVMLKFKALHQACWSSCRFDREQALVLHQQALGVEGVPLVDRLNSYFAALLRAYLECGAEDKWLNGTATLYKQLEGPLSITHYMYYRDRISVLSRLARHPEAVEAGRHYLDLLDTEAVDEPLQRRWWITDIWGQLIRWPYHALQDVRGTEAALAAAMENLQGYEEEWRMAGDEAALDEKKTYRRYYSYALNNLGCACQKAGLLAEAVGLLERNLEVVEHGSIYMHLATTYMMMDDRVSALNALQGMSQSTNAHVQKWIFVGDAKKWCHESEAFATVRQDPEFTGLFEEEGVLV